MTSFTCLFSFKNSRVSLDEILDGIFLNHKILTTIRFLVITRRKVEKFYNNNKHACIRFNFQSLLTRDYR